MDKFTYIDNANPAFIDDLYLKYKEDPNSIDGSWKKFFDGYEFASIRPSDNGHAVSNKEIAVVKLINAYRSRGHLIAKTKPIFARRHHKADLELDYFGLSEEDLSEEFEAGDEIAVGKAPLKKILDALKQTYCSSIGVEFMYCRDEELRQWLYNVMEPTQNIPQFSQDEKKHILKKLDQAVTFESFLQMKYIGKKRFSLEGQESLIPALDAAIREAAKLGAEEFVLGMAHRGRLNVLANIFGKTYEDVFSEFEGSTLPEDVKGDGDVKYHLGRSADITVDGKPVHLSLVPNPSHLEAVNPVVQGIVHGKLTELYENDPNRIIPVLIHGDAAYSGQGVNYEVVNMSRLDGYSTGGTVHIIINNQVGFTTSNREGRSSVYCTDLAKVTESPVFHVNVEDPFAVVHAILMAIRIRQKFGIDVYVDILGYRRYGHNEGDEPRFTQPKLYSEISKRPDIRTVCMQNMIANGEVTEAEAQEMTKEFKGHLQEKMEYAKTKKAKIRVDYFKKHWKNYRVANAKDFERSIETGAKPKDLDKVAKALVTEPKDFNLFNKMKKLLKTRDGLYFSDKKVDWAMAELLAYGSLLIEGHPVRISGQDSQRGTFSHRHSVIKDLETEKKYVPLNNIDSNLPPFKVYNSFLSEYCVLGFEYGFATARPNSLVVWEAQFGDFSNGAQIIIDQFISSGESKWQRMSGVTLFLPHGYEGQGPEHSSARPERFLQLCAENNMYVVNPTTPANFFHLIRRQVKNKFRIPLIVLTPKSLLRHPQVVSNISELNKGRFQEIIDDAEVQTKSVKRVIMCSGKVYYDLIKKREELGLKNVAVVRLEQLYPIAQPQIKALQKKYNAAKEWIWVQEEPINMGGWSHIRFHIPEIDFQVIARKASASPATGSEKLHHDTQDQLLNSAFEGLKTVKRSKK